MISINKVVKYYGDRVVLDSITSCLPKNKITSIIGPNGAGKSTLLSAIGRLLIPDSGSITVGGLNVVTTASDILAQRMAILLQEHQFINSRITVEELVGFGRFPYSKGRLNCEDREIIIKSLQCLDLLDRRFCYLNELSGGERQRVYIALILCQNTDYLLLDEPLNNLDMKHASKIMKLLRTMATELKKTIIIVVHDINFASIYSDFILAMKKGRLLHQGAVNTIMRTDILNDIFDLQLTIRKVDNQLIALHYD